MKIYPIYYIDAFTETLFTGNPAAVVILDQWLSDDKLRDIAAEVNLSETAFLVGNHIRWFTPKFEVNLCGHATLASAYVLIKLRNNTDNPLFFQSKSGELQVTHHDGNFSLNFPQVTAQRDESQKSLLENILGISIDELWLTHDRYICFIENEEIIKKYQPDFSKLISLPLPGVCITAMSNNSRYDFVSRYFAPAKGINEDPVTGTSHCAIAPLWSKKLNKLHLKARQISNRGGDILCELRDNRVYLTGKAVCFSKGEIYIHVD